MTFIRFNSFIETDGHYCIWTVKANYKKQLAKKTSFTTYNIDKIDFISLMNQARRYKILFQNVQSAFWAISLIPCNPTFVIQKFSIGFNHTAADLITSTSNISNHNLDFNTQLQTWYFSGQISLITANIKEVWEIKELVLFF